MKNWLARLGKKAAPRSGGARNPYRLLTEADIGKVFVAKDLEPHPNFGKYKILISLHTPGLYAFHTFDLVNGVPQGKLTVSHPAKQIYQEVSVDPDTLEKAKIEIEKTMACVREQLRESIKARNAEH